MIHFDAQMHQAGQRAQGYWLLSRLFLEVPAASMLAELQQLLADAGNVAASPELVSLRDAVSSALAHPDAAAVAYTRHLSLGDRKSGEPLPFEAHVREGRLPGDSTQQVAASMLSAGYGDVAPGASSPDHLGAELRFMALLCYREHEAWSVQGAEGAKKVLRHQQEFLFNHLAQWAPAYCRGLMTRTKDLYVRAIAGLAASTIDDDAKLLTEICRWLVPEDISPAASESGAMGITKTGTAV